MSAHATTELAGLQDRLCELYPNHTPEGLTSRELFQKYSAQLDTPAREPRMSANNRTFRAALGYAACFALIAAAYYGAGFAGGAAPAAPMAAAPSAANTETALMFDAAAEDSNGQPEAVLYDSLAQSLEDAEPAEGAKLAGSVAAAPRMAAAELPQLINEAAAQNEQYSFYYRSIDGKPNEISISQRRNGLFLGSFFVNDAEILDMFVSGDTLAVIERLYDADARALYGEELRRYTDGGVADASYSCGATTVTLYDVADPANVIQKGSFTQDGEFLQSRLLEDGIYIATQKPLITASGGGVTYAQLAPVTRRDDSDAQLLAEDSVVKCGGEPEGYLVLSRVSLADGKAETLALLGGQMTVKLADDVAYVLQMDDSEAAQLDLTLGALRVEVR